MKKQNIFKQIISMKIIISITTLSCIFSQENININGFIRDIESGEPISYANIFLSDTNYGTASNIDGYYLIMDIPVGEYELNVNIIGYKFYKKNIIITTLNSRMDVSLKKEILKAAEVNVTAERKKFERSIESSQVSLDFREINSAPALIEPDVFRTLQSLPGVQTISDFSSALYVRGSTPDQNLILLDGISVYNPYHLGGIFSTFNTESIKEADFHAGGFPARYGGRMGSILNIINREGNSKEVKGSANISLISTKALIEGPLPNWKSINGSWMFSGRRTYFDKIIDMLNIPLGGGNGKERDKSSQRVDDSGQDSEQTLEFPYYFYDYQAKLNLNIGDNHRLTYSRFHGDDRIDFSASDQQYSENTNQLNTHFNIEWPWGNKTDGITWRWIISPNLISKTFIANSRFRFDFGLYFGNEYTYNDTLSYNGQENINILSNISNFGINFYDIIKDQTIESEFIWIKNNKHTLTGGYQYKDVEFSLGMEFDRYSSQSILEYNQQNDSFFDTTIVQDTIFTPLDMQNSTRELSLFLQDEWKVSQLLSIQAGIRATNYSLHDSTYLEPRVGIKYWLSNDLSLKFNYGKFHQFLTIANSPDENFRIIDFWLGIPENKSASISEHTIVGLEYFSNNNILYRVEGYYKDFDNLLTLKEANFFSNSDGTVQTSSPFNEFWDTDAYSYGLELLIKKSSGDISGWIGYTYANAFYYLPEYEWHSPIFDRTHTINVVANFNALSKIKLSSSLSYSSGNPYTPLYGQYYEWWLNNGVNVNEDQSIAFLYGEKNSRRYDPYFRIDLGLTTKNLKIFGVNTEYYLQIINLTNHKNIFQYFYRQKTNIDTGNRIGVERFPITMFPFMPFIGVKFEF